MKYNGEWLIKKREFLAHLESRGIDSKALGQIETAFDLAFYCHQGQLRHDGTLYMTHCIAVALILVDEFGITDPNTIIIGLIHDTQEDSDLATQARLEALFNRHVANCVNILSKPEKGDPRFTDNRARLDFYFYRLKQVSYDETKIVKVADRVHYLRTMDSCTPEKRQRKIEETLRFITPLITDIERRMMFLGSALRQAMNKALRDLGVDPHAPVPMQ